METLKDDLHVLCIGDEHDDFPKELCQVVLDDVDVLANNLIGTSVSLPGYGFGKRLIQ